MICLKIRTFVVSATTSSGSTCRGTGCDLLENSYLCGISNNSVINLSKWNPVVICLKIRTFVVSATTLSNWSWAEVTLWFAWKFVPLWYQQQLYSNKVIAFACCDLLENSYLCGISNNMMYRQASPAWLWFAWKFVPLWYQQQQRNLISDLPSCCDLLENSYLCGISNNHSGMRHPSC